jgi:hypothetical protein
MNIEKAVIHKLADGSDCPLCVRESITQFFYEDQFIWVVMCKTCKVPMLVWKEHKYYLEPKELTYVWLMMKKLFNTIEIDTNMRQISTHWHAHILRKNEIF